MLGVDGMNFISASYNMYHNSIDITTFDGYILRIDCNKAEEGLKTTACYVTHLFLHINRCL